MGQDQEPGFNGNLNDLLHRAEAHLRKRSEATPQPEGPNQISSLIQRVSGASVTEIDRLIGELQSLRNYLLNEGQRIQREITDYTRLNQGAMESTRVINETLMKMKTGPDRAFPIQ
jgi:hypothetical protein